MSEEGFWCGFKRKKVVMSIIGETTYIYFSCQTKVDNIHKQYVICICMHLWGVAVLELDSHPDHNRRPDNVPCAFQKTHPIDHHRTQSYYIPDNLPFDCTTFVWKYQLCMVMSCTCLGTTNPSTCKINFAHLTKKQQEQLLTSLAVTQFWPSIETDPEHSLI